MNFDLNIWFSGIIFIVSAGILVYIWLQKFEIVFIFFALTPFIASLFFDNQPDTNIIVVDTSTGIEGYIRASILLTLGLVGIVKYLRNLSKSGGKIPTQLFLFGIFILFAFGTTFYSLDQRITLVRSTLLLSVLGFLIGFNSWLQQDGNIKKSLNILFVIVTTATIVTFISMFAVPARAWWWKATRLIGLWDNPNNLGSFCMLTYPILTWKFKTIKRKKRFYVIIPLIINITLHILSGSRSTLLASFIGIIIWFLMERSWIKLFFLTLLLGFSILILNNFSPSSFVREDTSDITNLSSRENIWQSAMIFIEASPFIGYGYGVHGKVFQDEKKIDLEGSFIEKNVYQSLHNGYLSIIISAGIIGLILWMIILLFPLWVGFHVPFDYVKAYSIVTMLMILITNITESNITGYSTATDIYFWIAWIIAGNLWLNSENQSLLKDGNKI